MCPYRLSVGMMRTMQASCRCHASIHSSLKMGVLLQSSQFWPIRTGTQARGGENKRGKYGLTAIKHQITLHLRICSWKHLSGNRSPRDVLKSGLPWLSCHNRCGPNMNRKDSTVAPGAPYSFLNECLRGDSPWIGPVLPSSGASESASDANPRQNDREMTRND